jgi:hypothetical protein
LIFDRIHGEKHLVRRGVVYGTELPMGKEGNHTKKEGIDARRERYSGSGHCTVLRVGL